MSTTKTSAASKAKPIATVAKKTTVTQKTEVSDKATSSTVTSKAKPEVGQIFISKRVWPD